MSEWVSEYEPTEAEVEWLNEQERQRDAGPQSPNGDRPLAPPWRSEPWSEFRDVAEEEPRWLVHGLLPEGALVFVAAPPKKGKTWLALGIALSIASGRPFLQEYAVDEPRDTLYVALEGSRSAIRARTGSLARGLGIDPDSDELERLRFLYRPRPFDLAQPESAAWLQREQEMTQASFVVVDVLRAAARFRENVSEDFALVRDSFEPLLDRGCTVALLHHFGKLSVEQRDRSPGERMAGTGAMYGALDVGLLITKSEAGARRLRVDVEARDFAAPDAIGVAIVGTGSGEHGGFRYADTATFVVDASAAEERDLVAELEELFSDGAWRTLTELSSKKDGIGANKDELRAVLEQHPERFSQVTGPMVGRHVNATPWGTIAMRQGLAQHPEPDEPDTLFEGSASHPSERVAPPTGETTPSHTFEAESGSGSGSSSQTGQTDEEDDPEPLPADEDPGF